MAKNEKKLFFSNLPRPTPTDMKVASDITGSCSIDRRKSVTLLPPDGKYFIHHRLRAEATLLPNCFDKNGKTSRKG